MYDSLFIKQVATLEKEITLYCHHRNVTVALLGNGKISQNDKKSRGKIYRQLTRQDNDKEKDKALGKDTDNDENVNFTFFKCFFSLSASVVGASGAGRSNTRGAGGRGGGGGGLGEDDTRAADIDQAIDRYDYLIAFPHPREGGGGGQEREEDGDEVSERVREGGGKERKTVEEGIFALI